jgi:hypothetical protein
MHTEMVPLTPLLNITNPVQYFPQERNIDSLSYLYFPFKEVLNLCRDTLRLCVDRVPLYSLSHNRFTVNPHHNPPPPFHRPSADYSQSHPQNSLVINGADPGCLSWIPDPNFFHPGSRILGKKDSESGSASKNLSIFNPKNVSKLSGI